MKCISFVISISLHDNYLKSTIIVKLFCASLSIWVRVSSHSLHRIPFIISRWLHNITHAGKLHDWKIDQVHGYHFISTLHHRIEDDRITSWRRLMRWLMSFLLCNLLLVICHDDFMLPDGLPRDDVNVGCPALVVAAANCMHSFRHFLIRLVLHVSHLRRVVPPPRLLVLPYI